jgi:hypothetical protein
MTTITRWILLHRIVRFAFDTHTTARTVGYVAFRAVWRPLIAFHTATQATTAVRTEWKTRINGRITTRTSYEPRNHHRFNLQPLLDSACNGHLNNKLFYEST